MEANKTIYVSFPRSEIENLRAKYEVMLDDWKKHCNESHKEVTELKEQITKLKFENKRLNDW